MRRALIGLSLAALFVALIGTPAAGAPPSSDPATAAKIAATWLANQVNDQGFIPQATSPSTPNLSNSAQAVIALAAAGVGGTQVDALLGYLGAHVDDFVVSGGEDNPGSLAFLILGIVAAGQDPTDFGSSHDDLVTRLEDTLQPSGLFGAADPTFDGAFRQGLALIALHAAGESNGDATDWLVDQQCDDGSWTAFRADTSVACPPVDPVNFTGPDTNSTAMAALGLHAQGRTGRAAQGATALLAVRNAQGAWGYLADDSQLTDANSTGLVVAALRTINGTSDAQGLAALLALQVGCDGDLADVGGIAFQSDPAGLTPDQLATLQAIPALAGVELPLSSVTISPSLTEPCPAPASTTTTTTATTTTTTAPSTAILERVGTGTGTGTTSGPSLAQGGSPAITEVGIALVLVGTGTMLVQLAQQRRRRFT